MRDFCLSPQFIQSTASSADARDESLWKAVAAPLERIGAVQLDSRLRHKSEISPASVWLSHIYHRGAQVTEAVGCKAIASQSSLIIM